MESSSTASKIQSENIVRATMRQGSLPTISSRVLFGIYGLVLAVSISIWFLAIRAPLWLDETGSFQQINAGFSGIPDRQGLSFAAYSYILWFCTKIIGTSEIALRVPEILAMLGAVYLLYCAARELFDRDVAVIAAVVFCLHPIVVFAAIDVRPYAFAAIAINAAILCLVRLRDNNSNWLAALFGVSAAVIVYLQLLFLVLTPALAICFFLVKRGEAKTIWRQFGVALTAFVLAFLPAIPRLYYVLHSSGTHVFSEAPQLWELVSTLAPWRLLFTFLGAAFVAAATRHLELPTRSAWRILLCASLGLIPILILYGVSSKTSMHVFVPRYQLVAIPGIALCWALLVSLIDSRVIRLLFCVVVLAAFSYGCVTSPYSKLHGYSWKDALQAAERSASVDGAPLLVCSDFVEADHMSMPVGSAVKDSAQFAPLSYYKISGPVVGLPRALNDEAKLVGSNFLLEATRRRERFLALGYRASYETLDWLAASAARTHDVRVVGVYDGVAVVEFTPRTPPDSIP